MILAKKLVIYSFNVTLSVLLSMVIKNIPNINDIKSAIMSDT